MQLSPEWHQLIDIGTRATAIASILHTVLPPWDWEPDFVTVGLADFPGAQKMFRGFFHNKYYKLLIYSLGYIAINARSTFWKSISVGQQIKNAANGTKQP